jgi:hypothetical protein
MPTAVEGDVFQLTLEDGRIFDCYALSSSQNQCAVLHATPVERRRRQRLSPTARAHL